MRAVPAVLAILNIQGLISEDERGHMSRDEAWQVLRGEVENGYVPVDYGDDVSKWAAWLDRRCWGAELFRPVGSASGTGKFVAPADGQAFASVSLLVEPVSGEEVSIDTTGCAGSCYADSAAVAACFMAVEHGIKDFAARNRLVGINVSVREISLHPLDIDADCLKTAAARAMSNAVEQVEKVEI